MYAEMPTLSELKDSQLIFIDVAKCPDYVNEAHCLDQPIKMSDHPTCNSNEIFWHFCDYKCHCDADDVVNIGIFERFLETFKNCKIIKSRQSEISSIVARFECDKLIEGGQFPNSFLNETTCQMPRYENPRWVD